MAVASRDLRTVTVVVFLAIKTESGHEEEVHKLLDGHSEVTESHLVIEGPYDVVALISVEAFDDYREFAVDTMGALPHVEDYTSFIATTE
ncbi:Lrp/AsnC family transcriptional regulator [Candidatus Thorarchaeota archaeon]|jgi:DNA-binding Lrp family transcriptional regulator|nr:MAG: Lrp/AsnC family transcriptional regulator [Candidatus Thorarchaeota archaeon]